MAKLTSTYYINNNDFEGCLERFDKARPQWKEHWLETLHTIFNNCKEWAKKYIFDPITNTYHKVGAIYKERKIKKAIDERIVFENPTDKQLIGCGGTYIIEHYDEQGNRLWLKVGKANNFRDRLVQQLRGFYSKPFMVKVNKILVKKLYPFDNENISLTMENVARSYFQTQNDVDFIPNDRFANAFWTETAENTLNNKYLQAKILFAQRKEVKYD